MVVKKAHLIVHGLVQGVGYRYSAFRKANQLQLKGWVRNRPDGTVELQLEGEPEKVGEMVLWCREGPPASRVTDVEVEWCEGEPSFSKFEIRY